ncbi:hypothetical protein [Corynebacterium sp. H130]|uniref:hypothetical protein n=1 Tax=Corynebacterium sp. H130 TaxID=3133444 RepID=UPI0030967A06
MEYLAAIGLKPYLADTYRTQARPQSLIHDPVEVTSTFQGRFENDFAMVSFFGDQVIPALKAGETTQLSVVPLDLEKGVFLMGNKEILIADPHNWDPLNDSPEVTFTLLFKEAVVDNYSWMSSWHKLRGKEFRATGKVVDATYHRDYWLLAVEFSDCTITAACPGDEHSFAPGDHISGDAIVTGFFNLTPPPFFLDPQFDIGNSVESYWGSARHDHGAHVIENHLSAMGFTYGGTTDLQGSLNAANPDWLSWKNHIDDAVIEVSDFQNNTIIFPTLSHDFYVSPPNAGDWGGALAGIDLMFYIDYQEASKDFGATINDPFATREPVSYLESAFIIGRVIDVEEIENDFCETTYHSLTVDLGNKGQTTVAINSRALESIGIHPEGTIVAGRVEKITSELHYFNELQRASYRWGGNDKIEDAAKLVNARFLAGKDLNTLELCAALHCSPATLERRIAAIGRVEEELPADVDKHEYAFPLLMLSPQCALHIAAATKWLEFLGDFASADYTAAMRELVDQLDPESERKSTQLFQELLLEAFGKISHDVRQRPICAETTEDIIRQTFAAISDRRLMEMHADTSLGHEVKIIEPYDLDLRDEGILTYREHVTGRWSCVHIYDLDFAIFLGSHYLPEDIPPQQALL